MEFRVPKVLEKRPEVWGFALAKVAIIIFSCIGLLFIGFYNLPLGLVFPSVGGVYFYVDKKYPGKGELVQFIKYTNGNKCIHCNQSLNSLTNKIIEMEEI